MDVGLLKSEPEMDFLEPLNLFNGKIPSILSRCFLFLFLLLLLFPSFSLSLRPGPAALHPPRGPRGEKRSIIVDSLKNAAFRWWLTYV